MHVTVGAAKAQLQPVPVAETKVKRASSVSVTVITPLPVDPAGTPPLRRGVSVKVMFCPCGTLVGEADLVIDTSALPPLTVVLATAVLLFGSPSPIEPVTSNEPEIVPATLPTAGTVNVGATPLTAIAPVRVQLIEPLERG